MVDEGRCERIASWRNPAFSPPPPPPPPLHKSAINTGSLSNSNIGDHADDAVHTTYLAPPFQCASPLERDNAGRFGFGSKSAADHGSAGRLFGMRVLVVEDEALVALDLQFALEDEGAIVIGPALSLSDALDLVGREPRIDGAILDVDLAGLEVYPAADMLRARDIPFVFHTGHGSRASLSERFPGSLTCSKPTLPSALITALLQA
jgi:CheY-like chemotaxis protein